jgi:hypothetical protein
MGTAIFVVSLFVGVPILMGQMIHFGTKEDDRAHPINEDYGRSAKR